MIPRQPLRRDDFRFELRPYDFSCVPGLYQAAIESRREITPWLQWLRSTYNLQDTENWMVQAINAWKNGSGYEFVIYDREEGAPIGSCGLNDINRKDMVANLGYWVRTAKTRLGAATQATLLLKDFGLNIVGLNRVELVIAEGNEASRRVAEKVGAIYEGLQRRRIKVGDKVYDAHMYVFV
jgi:RimJ/RimL family protein N-acetyltransferase